MDLLKWLRGVNLYDFTIAALLVIAAIGVFEGNSDALVPLATSVLAAAVLDYAIGRLVDKKANFIPKSAIITGLIVGMVITPGNLVAAAGVAAIAILSKHLLAISKRPLFNPAAFALVVCVLVFSYSDSWWAAAIMANQPLTFIVAALALAAAWKVGKLPLMLSYLVAEAAITAIFVGVAVLASMHGLLIILGGVFFAGFMLDEPKTSAIPKKAQVAEGILVAVLAFAIVQFLPALAGVTDTVLLSLLAVNLLVPQLNSRLR